MKKQKIKKVVVASVIGLTLLAGSTLPSLSEYLGSDQTVQAANVSFKDVPTSSANYKAIQDLVNRGVIKGFADGTFKPKKNVTRAEFASFVARALKLPAATSNFKDVPKTAALYDGVSRAYKAGVVRGLGDGTFKPNTSVNRQDMAAMIDRAMQLKGNFTKTKKLNFSDNDKIGLYAKTSVQRVYYYNIMGVYKNAEFAGTTIGTREETAQALYRMLIVIEGGSVEEIKPPAVNKPLNKYTYNELVHILGEWEVIRRGSGDGTITVIDVVKEMYDDVKKLPNNAPALKLSPKEFFKTYNSFTEAQTLYFQAYPKFEYTAINGVPFRHSGYYPEIFNTATDITTKELNSVIPNPPTEKNKFLIDLPRFNKDVVTYQNEKVYVERMGTHIQKSASNKDYYVDIKALFNDVSLVSVSKNGLDITFNGKTLKLQVGSANAKLDNSPLTLSNKVKVENGKVLAPIKSVANALGIYWRMMYFDERLELANYPLDSKGWGWKGE